MIHDDFKDIEDIDFGEGAPMPEPPKPPLEITLLIRAKLERLRMYWDCLPTIWHEWRNSKRDIEELRRREKRGGGSR